ncbi:TetR/AcrR family transcriptional regulator [Novosphingobium fluoreni]|uniref:TetR/AcrR family transcriptional regulator n=1 Tax=Novosphingobium fluoreni TaxID=1391222 RepID=UPI003D9FD5AB
MSSSINRDGHAVEKAARAKPAGSLRTGLKKFTRQRLLDAALQCFREYGYQQTSVERIAKIAGTTVPTFYRHFPSKGELLHPLLDYLTGEVEATLRELDALDVRDCREVRRWLDSYIVMWGRVHKLCAAHWEAVNIDPSYAGHLMDDAISCASVMRRTMSRLPAERRAVFGVRMGLVTMFVDRLALAVSVEANAARAHQIMDEFSKMLWLILNDNAALG